MFPGPGAVIYRNDAGEVLGWDYPSDDPPEVDEYRQQDLDAAWETAAEMAVEEICGAQDYECSPSNLGPCPEHESRIEAQARQILDNWNRDERTN